MSTPLVSDLQAQQAALLNALFARPGQATAALDALTPYLDTRSAQGQRGLKAYQANGHSLAERSLRAAFPVIEMMMGSGNFAALARDLWHRSPPERGDLALWGAALPGFLAHEPQLANTPYLADVAQVEWALHRVAFAADAQPDPASFVRLGSQDPATLSLTLAPGTAVIPSRFPIASLVLAHQQASPSLADAARRLQEGHAESVVVWRQGLKPQWDSSSNAATALLRGLLQGHDLAQAIDAALVNDAPGAQDFDFSVWLTQAVTRQLITGVHDVPAVLA